MPEHHNTRLAGHGLQSEGRPFEWGEYSRNWVRVYGSSRTGAGLCECGSTSEILESDAARQRWHAAHKEQMRNG